MAVFVLSSEWLAALYLVKLSWHLPRPKRRGLLGTGLPCSTRCQLP